MEKQNDQFATFNYLLQLIEKRNQILKPSTILYNFNLWELKSKIPKDSMSLIRHP